MAVSIDPSEQRCPILRGSPATIASCPAHEFSTIQRRDSLAGDVCGTFDGLNCLFAYLNGKGSDILPLQARPARSFVLA